jgi:hypothetical protein
MPRHALMTIRATERMNMEAKFVETTATRKNCGDYIHVVRWHKLKKGNKVLGVVLEQWGEDFKGKEIDRHFFDLKIDGKFVHVNRDANKAYGEILRFFSLETAKANLLKRV